MRDPAYRIRSANNLHEIAIAFDAYQKEHGHLPPAVTRDKSGNGLHSWRVLLLPYLDGGLPLYREFHLDEPWDSPHNIALLPRIPEVYAPPRGMPVDAEPYTTFYQVFVGKGAAFEGDRGFRTREDFPDGISNTMLAAEAAKAVPWTKPADLAFDPDKPLPPLGGLFNGKGRFSMVGSGRSTGFNTLYVDGSTHFLVPSLPEWVIRALITRNGGEPLLAP